MPELVVLTEQLLADVPGGTGRYTAELATALARTAPAGWHVTGVVSRHADVTAASLPGVRGPRVLPLPRRALVAAWRAGLPPFPGGDRVHAPTPLAPGRLGRCVVTVHDAVAWTHPQTLTPRGAAWHRAAISAATRRAAAVVVPTEAVATDLRRYAPGRAPLHVIGHGVTALPDAAMSDVAVPLPARYVLAVGTVEPRKGLDVLLAAVAELDDDVALVVAGQPGWGAVDLAGAAAARGWPAPRLRLLGRIGDAELAAVLRGAAVLAVPSLAEGFGLPLLEAMAAGVPVVHSDAPALVELAAGTGLVAARGDVAATAAALRKALVRDEKRIASARARAAGFSWDAAAAAVWRLHTPGAEPTDTVGQR